MAAAGWSRGRRFGDWSLRWKIVGLLGAASLLPLSIAAIVDIREARGRAVRAATDLLSARADELVGRLDTLDRGYARAVHRLAGLPAIVLATTEIDRAAEVKKIFDVWHESDPAIRGLELVDGDGVVRIASELALVGIVATDRAYIREALRGRPAISDVYVSRHEVGDVPTVAFAHPILQSDRVVGAVAVFIRASAIWDTMRDSNELGGTGSFAVMFDREGVRIGHSYSQDMVFHPGGPLDPATIETWVKERRLGPQTRRLLSEPRAFPEQFERARAVHPDPGLFRGYAPVNGTWNVGVARRLTTTDWTVFYMLPEATLDEAAATVTRSSAIFAGFIIVAALVVGLLFARGIVTPVRALAVATLSFGRGDRAVRVVSRRADEFGTLATSFNAMADEIGGQASALEAARDVLEARVIERTAEVAASEQRLEITLMSIGDAVIATDEQGHITRMNPVAERMTGWALESARGRPLGVVFNIVDEDTNLPVESPVDRVLRDGVIVGLANHTALISKDGTSTPIADSGAPIRDANGNIRGVVLVFQDQTPARAAARQLRASEARKTAILESAVDAVISIDADGTIIELNPAAESMFGRPAGEVVGRPLADTIIPAELRDAHRNGLARYLATRTASVLDRRLELSAVRADGTVFPVEVSITRVGRDEPPTFTGFIRDITEPKAARAELLETHRRLHTLAEVSSLLVTMVTNQQQLLDKIVRVTADLVGDGCMVTLIDADGESLVNVANAHRDPVLENAYKAYLLSLGVSKTSSSSVSATVIRSGEPTLIPEVDPLTLAAQVDEELRPLVVHLNVRSVVVVPIRVREVVIGTVSIQRTVPGRSYTRDDVTLLQDIADRTGLAIENVRLYDGLERRVRQRTAELEMVNQELEAFSYSVAHDLRAPLRGMNGFARALLDDYEHRLDSDAVGYLHRIQHNAVVMGQLIDALLSLARVGRSELQPKLTDLSALARAITDRLQATQPEREVGVLVEDGLRAIVDPTLARTLLENLIENAWKFTGKSPRPRIEVGVLRDGATFFVRDNGAGFAMDHAGKLFVAFQRLHANREFPGTGIGLATVRRIVERHGGRVWAEGRVDEGATFSFTLPTEGSMAFRA